jgi:hypothetical protein
MYRTKFSILDARFAVVVVLALLAVFSVGGFFVFAGGEPGDAECGTGTGNQGCGCDSGSMGGGADNTWGSQPGGSWDCRGGDNFQICEYVPPPPSDGGSGGGGGGGGGGVTPSTQAQQCQPVYVCGGGNLVNSCTGDLIQACAYSCASGACLPPPPPSFIAFTASNAGGSFQADGHLQAKPALLAKGSTTQLYWNTENVSSCTVTGTNGDAFSGVGSGASGRTSGPISSQTTYTLICQSLPGATPATITETATVNVVPVFQEV